VPNIKAFRPVVHEKIVEDLTIFSLFCPWLGPKRSHVPCQISKHSGQWFM